MTSKLSVPEYENSSVFFMLSKYVFF
jgi:hypothetical protein